MGDIAASRVLQVGNQSLPRLRSPLLDRIAGVVESKKNVLSTVLTLLFSNFTNFFRITQVSWNRFDGFVTRTLFLVPPVYLCGFDPGSRALRCCRDNFIDAVLEYLCFADIENLFYAVVGEITSTSPNTGEFGSIAITRITDAFRRLRYTISEGFLVMC